MTAIRYVGLFGAVAGLLLAFAPWAQAQDEKDPHVQQGGERFKDNREVVSPLILQKPIYACTDTVVVKGFVTGAKLEVIVDGASTPAGTKIGVNSSGDPVKLSSPLAVGQVVTARQVVNGIPGPPSNAVTVTSHLDDYPGGLPQPRLAPTPCFDCGRAVGIADVIPGAWWKVYAEDALGGGMFAPPVEVGGNQDFGYTFVNPAFKKGQRITAQSGICSDKSPISLPEIVQATPPLPAPTVQSVVGNDRVVVWGSGGPGTPLVNGATLSVMTDGIPPNPKKVGGQPTPGGGQQVLVSPNVLPANYWARQDLCSKGPDGPHTPAIPCEKMPAPKIRTPMPGDTTVELTDYVPGATIRVYVGSEEIGDGGGPLLALTRPVKAGETLTVVQSMGKCTGNLIYVIEVGCADRDPNACSGSWPAFRQSGLRDAQQRIASDLAQPDRVKTLTVAWQFPFTGSVGGFRASPIVHRGRVFVGSQDGHLYALDELTGKLLWQYPKAGDPPLLSQFSGNASSVGLAASATIAIVREREAVVFGAPDQSIGANLGSGRLFALDPATGAEIWKSPEIAKLTGLTHGSTNELHEQFGYSSPLALGNRIHIGIADHADSPIQNGRVAAVDANSGTVLGGFSFSSTSTRGGGIWSSVAGGLDANAIFITTGNARVWNGGSQSEPAINHSLSLLRLDAATGAVNWKLQPVPFKLDNDPDWASGPTLLPARCGNTVASTQKDGWSYAVRTAGNASARWQFPPTGFPFATTPPDHGDTRYLVPGAAWNDTFITMTGGYPVEASHINTGFNLLYGLDVCGARHDPIRWIAEIPSASASPYQLGPPSVTRGVIFIGTASGHLVALADPAVWVTGGSVCSNPEVSVADCVANGFRVVPKAKVLVNIALGAGGIATEPALANGRVFVSTSGGKVFMLQPK
ncbi:MAG TPA: PQQ-binding-like beta-propeller repeat protein [Burkholderiales bacterium]|nr:PQQ-binding-like beta-propeller repeat protein [Burkholderiales bacterium]